MTINVLLFFLRETKDISPQKWDCLQCDLSSVSLHNNVWGSLDQILRPALFITQMICFRIDTQTEWSIRKTCCTLFHLQQTIIKKFLSKYHAELSFCFLNCFALPAFNQHQVELYYCTDDVLSVSLSKLVFFFVLKRHTKL